MDKRETEPFSNNRGAQRGGWLDNQIHAMYIQPFKNYHEKYKRIRLERLKETSYFESGKFD